MAPKDGALKRVVLWSEAFSDRTVDLLAKIENLQRIVRGVEELRFVATRVTPAGVRLLQRLIPHTRVNLVSGDAWMVNVQTRDPDYSLEAGSFKKQPVPPEAERLDSEAKIGEMLKQRYGPSAKLTRS
jgi:hypothetical protein